jgi:hypothetical protein
MEHYLWPHWSQETSADFEHVLSLVVLINEKFREEVPVWDILTKGAFAMCVLGEAHILCFLMFYRPIQVHATRAHSHRDSARSVPAIREYESTNADPRMLSSAVAIYTAIHKFLQIIRTGASFSSLGACAHLSRVVTQQELVRREVGRLVHIPLWDALTPARLKLELKKYPQLKKVRCYACSCSISSHRIIAGVGTVSGLKRRRIRVTRSCGS